MTSASGQHRSAFAAIVRGILTHPAAMTLKRRLRDLRWQSRGRTVVNPALPARVHEIVFVCLGNICRSPFAAVLMIERLKSDRPEIRVISAGLNTKQSNRPPDAAVAAAHLYGCALEGHRPAAVTAATIASADMIVAMEVGQIAELQARWPEGKDRYFLLPLFEPPSAAIGAFERCNLVDPFGKDDAEFRRCYERIDRAITAMIRQLP